MTSAKLTTNRYCTEPEDKVIAWSCPCCRSCWLYVASRGNRKNNSCPYGGPFGGYEKQDLVQGVVASAEPGEIVSPAYGDSGTEAVHDRR